MSQTITMIGPNDHGRRMALDEFDQAEGQPGYLYELSRGIITVVDVPKRRHLAQLYSTRRQFSAYDLANPGKIHTIAGGAECKILLAALNSERHPDLAIYLRPPFTDVDLWATWIPEIVIEIVSRGSEHRDYTEKREEYWLFGVQEYWIIDAAKEEMLVLRRSGAQWAARTVRPKEIYQSALLPGFEFRIDVVLQAAREAGSAE